MSKSKQPFGKFIQQKEKGSQKKERIRQEKKAVRQETKAYFDQKKAEVKAQREQYRAQNADYRNLRSEVKGQQSDDGRRAQGTGEERQGGSSGRDGKKFENKGYNQRSEVSGQKPEVASKRLTIGNTRPATGNRESTGASPKAFNTSRPAVTGKKAAGASPKVLTTGKSPVTDKKAPYVAGSKQAAKTQPPTTRDAQPATGNRKPVTVGKSAAAASSAKPEAKVPKQKNEIPLNKFLAHSGVSARREAAEIVKSGLVAVNGRVVTEPGFKVTERDEIKVNGKQINIRKNMVYILLNKPKDFITTTEDPQGRKTVLDLIKHATTERVYPVGRLDRNTTGVLLLTNDGELAQKLTHPSYQIKKIYEVKLDKPLVKKDFDAIINGIELEDGVIAPDVLAYADSKDKSVIGIEIHSGRNRIVRRIFEHLGYDVRNLDRVMYANLTKKNVDRGKWRLLSEKEVRLLKFLNSSFTNKSKSPARG
jgi:23S rRNA pseudouridine2605 synthase